MRRAVATAVTLLAAGGALAGAATASATLIQFRSPTGKIGCAATNMNGPYNLRCDVQSPTFTPPARGGCDLDNGDSFSMSAKGRPVWTCHGDTALGAGKVLGYGRTWSWGPFRCTMRTSGITCRNNGGHGFMLSQQRASRW